MSASDHPETIFMAPDRDYENIWARPTIKDEFCDDPDAVEYTRADLPPTDAQIAAHPKVRALIEAAGEVYRLSQRDTKSWWRLRAALAAFEKP